jgi:hypothetical protein
MDSLRCSNLEEELEEILDTELDPGLTLFRGEEVYEACKTKAAEETIQSWKGATPRLERWRKDLKTLTVELKQPRVIDVAPIDFVSGEPVEREGPPTNKFRGQLLYLTNADLTIRR